MKTNQLDELNEKAQEGVLAMAETMSERHVVEVLNAPRPKGLGLMVSRTGLHGWVQRKRREKILEEAKERMAEAAKLASSAAEGATLEEGMLQMLRQRMFEEATGDLEPGELQALYRLAKQESWKREQMELTRRKVQATEEQVRLARERLQLNAAKLALSHAGELRGLITEGEVGDGEKLQGALARLFGEKFAKAAKAIPEGNDK